MARLLLGRTRSYGLWLGETASPGRPSSSDSPSQRAPFRRAGRHPTASSPTQRVPQLSVCAEQESWQGGGCRDAAVSPITSLSPCSRGFLTWQRQEEEGALPVSPPPPGAWTTLSAPAAAAAAEHSFPAPLTSLPPSSAGFSPAGRRHASDLSLVACSRCSVCVSLCV